MVLGALCTSMCTVSTDVEGNQFDPIVFSWFSSQKCVESITLVGEFYGNCKGMLGGSSKLDDICKHLNEDEYDGLGSVKFRCTYKGTNLHIIVFNTGKIKISGGTPSNVTNDEDMRAFLDGFYEDMCEWLVVCTKEWPKVCCWNGNEKLVVCNEKILKQSAANAAGKFAIIMKPNLECKGRRCAYKFYLHANRKLHIAVDYKGSMQIFAAKSFQEMKDIISIFKMLEIS